MIGVREALIWGVAIIFVVVALGCWVMAFVSSWVSNAKFERYIRVATPGMSYWARYQMRRKLFWQPEELKRALDDDSSGLLDEALSWRNRAYLGIAGFAGLIGGAWALIGLFKFLAYVYVKGQQAG